MDTRNWWRSAIGVVALTLVSCMGETTDPRLADSPLYNRAAHGNAGELDFIGVARFTRLPRVPPVSSARIGPEGGSLHAGEFELIVPAGAVDRPTLFQIVLPARGIGDPVYAEFSPHQQFAAPVTLRLPSAGTDAGASAVIMWWSGERWVPLPTSETADGRLETQVGHFSFYATSRGIIVSGG